MEREREHYYISLVTNDSLMRKLHDFIRIFCTTTSGYWINFVTDYDFIQPVVYEGKVSSGAGKHPD